jgi:hypothetical protein
MHKVDSNHQTHQPYFWIASTLVGTAAVYALCQNSTFLSAMDRIQFRNWQVWGPASAVALTVGGVATYCLKSQSKLPQENQALTRSPYVKICELKIKSLLQGPQQGSNPGGKVEINGEAHYVKFPRGERETKKLWNEWLASQIYRLCGVPFPEVHLAAYKDEPLCLHSKWIESWKPLGYKADGSGVNQIPANPTEFYENYVIDAWINAWDVIGLAGDNIGFVEENGEHKCYRLDAGGAFNDRAQAAEAKRHSYGDETYSEETLSLKSMLERNLSFWSMTLDHFNTGIERLAACDDRKVFDLIMGMEVRNPSEKLDFFIHLVKRKQLLLGYANWLKSQDIKENCFHQIVNNHQYGLEQFRKVFKANPLLGATVRCNVDSPMEEIAWEVVSNYYLRSATDEYKEYYPKGQPLPTHPIQRIKHGGMHVVSAAIAGEKLAQLLRDNLINHISDSEIKYISIALLFHDSGRLKDTGNDKAEWERQGAAFCKDYMIKLGISERIAEFYSSLILNKDGDNRGLHLKIFHDADCLEVLRSHGWVFDPSYLDISDDLRDEIDPLITDYRTFVEKRGDAGRDWNGRKANFDVETKRKFEHSPYIYRDLKQLFESCQPGT